MPNLWDKLPEGPPASELNPLTNPLLERNLRRWANVYFGNPPAKRERAINDLLEQLKQESNTSTSGPAAPSQVREARPQGAVCSACGRQNPLGHKFCSRCGGTLGVEQVPPLERVDPPHPAVPRFYEATLPRPVRDAPLARQEFNSLKAFDTQPRRGWKYLIVAAIIAVAGFLYLHWTSRTQTAATHPTSTRPASPAPSATRPAPTAIDDSSSDAMNRPPEADSSAAATVPTDKPDTLPVPNRAIVPSGLQSAAQRVPLPPATTAPRKLAEEAGASDVRLAERYLAGSMGRRDSSEAAKLLWKAVGKQNATANLLLSDLYLRGDGVGQSCDQARLLLVAAARKGSAQAARQLRTLETRGCR